MLGLELPAAATDKLAGASVLPLAQKHPMPDRKDYIVVEYHCGRPFVSRWHVLPLCHVPTPRALCVAAFYSSTGTFMVRHGNHKLIIYGKDKVFGTPFPPQLYDLSTDPNELR